MSDKYHSKFISIIEALDGKPVFVRSDGATFSGLMEISGDCLTLQPLDTANGLLVSANKSGEGMLFLDKPNTNIEIHSVTSIREMEKSPYWSSFPGSRYRDLIEK